MHLPLARLSSLLLLTTALRAADPVEARRFTVTTLATGLSQPMEFERLPDGRILWIELAGKLKLLDPATGRVSDAGELPVWNQQESGLLGLALDPAFAENGWLYLHWSPVDFTGNQVARYRWTGDRIDPASEKILLRWEVQREECCHHAGCLEFGPDGSLFIATGDNTFPAGDSNGYAPVDERPGKGPRDAQKSAANPADLRGKILRIRPTPEGGYAIPEGNLFPPGTAGTRPEIYVMGCRNPWRISVDPRTGHVYWGEVGPDAGGDSAERGPRGYDELNQAKAAGNFGWPLFIADNQAYVDWDFATGKPGPRYDPAKPVNDSPLNTGARVLPPAQNAFIFWPYGASARWPSLGQGGRTACAGPVFYFEERYRETGGFPAALDRHLLFFDWNRPFIKWAQLDADANLVDIRDFAVPGAIKRPAQARFNPDGTLDLVDWGSTWGVNADSRLLRIGYRHGNLPPVAKAAVTPPHGALPLRLQLDAAGSEDPDGSPLRYAWRLQPGGRVLAEVPATEVTLNEAGAFSIELVVTDAAGAAATNAVEVVAGNTPPVVRFVEPAGGSFWVPGQMVRVRAEVTDAEEADASGFAVRTQITAQALNAGDAAHPGLALMKQSDCFNCHQVRTKVIGPAFLEIAQRYQGNTDALEMAVNRVHAGSQGVWGPIPMLPHPTLSKAQIRGMVEWVFALRDAAAPVSARGLETTLEAPADPAAGGWTIEVTTQDTGHGAAPPLTGRAALTLRSPRLEAESPDEMHGPRALEGTQASGRKFAGAIDHNHRLVWKALDLRGRGAVAWRVASGGAGAKVQLRAGGPEGAVLAEVDVPNNGGWENWAEKVTPLQNVPDGATDVTVVFLHPGRSGLMNLDWLEFRAAVP